MHIKILSDSDWFSLEIFPEYNVTTAQKVSWKYDCSFITSLEDYMEVSSTDPTLGNLVPSQLKL